MFGVVPKSIWDSLNPADENNMCSWALRCLLIEDGSRLMLVDNGIGEKQDKKFFSYYYLHGNDSLEESLKENGFSKEDITDVFLTHLHFDHCGGSIKWNQNRTGYETSFKNATYWSHSEHWQWATNPNAREKASFLKENILPVKESGQLKFLDQEFNNSDKKKTNADGLELLQLTNEISAIVVRGHTDAMMLPCIKYKEKTVVYMADLIPSTGHIPLAYVMAYDTRPLITLQEKSSFLERASKNNFHLIFEHDPAVEGCTLINTEGRIRKGDEFRISEI